MGEGLDQIGAALGVSGPAGLIAHRMRVEIEQAPGEQAGAQIGRECHGVGAVFDRRRGEAVEIGFDRHDVGVGEFGISGVRHYRIFVFGEHEERRAGLDAVMECAPELLVGPGADAVALARRDVGREDGAERGADRAASGESGFADEAVAG